MLSENNSSGLSPSPITSEVGALRDAERIPWVKVLTGQGPTPPGGLPDVADLHGYATRSIPVGPVVG